MSINTYYSFIVFDIIKYKLLETEVIFITEVYDGGASTMDGKEEYDKKNRFDVERYIKRKGKAKLGGDTEIIRL